MEWPSQEVRRGQIISVSQAKLHRDCEASKHGVDASDDSRGGQVADGSHTIPRSRRQEKKDRKTERRMDNWEVVNAQIRQNFDIIEANLDMLQPDGFLPLVFIQPPTIENLDQTPVLELVLEDPINTSFLQYEKEIEDSIQDLRQLNMDPQTLTSHSLRIKLLLPRLEDRKKALAHAREKEWQRQLMSIREIPPSAIVINPGQHEQFSRQCYFINDVLVDFNPQKSWDPVFWLIHLITAVLHLLANLSMKDANFLLVCMGIVLQQAMANPNPLAANQVVSSIPSDVRTVLSSMKLDPSIKPMVCCPRCFQTHFIDENNPTSYPEFCQYKETPRSKTCGRRLRQTKETAGRYIPTRRFLYHDLHQWVGRMYARPDIEKHIDEYPPKYGQGKNTAPKEMKDIWDASVLRDLKGPDGKPFMDKPEREGRLVFALNMDGFNPSARRRNGRAASISGIYLVCLNLPPDIRYKIENVFLVGIVPGPHEPSTHQVNHLLRPLVDDLLQLWSPGIYLRRTAKYPNGRLVKGALIPVVCDLPAARRVAGLGGHSCTRFCSECLQKLEDINDLDTSSWVPRNCEEHRKHAAAWRDASTHEKRNEVFKEYGAKWSELLRLPYWDPTQFVIIDSMHAFYLRLFSRHIREVWGMDVDFEDGRGLNGLDIGEEEMTTAEKVLRSGSKADLKELTKVQLQYLCHEAGINYGTHKTKLIGRLIKHVSSKFHSFIFDKFDKPTVTHHRALSWDTLMRNLCLLHLLRSKHYLHVQI